MVQPSTLDKMIKPKKLNELMYVYTNVISNVLFTYNFYVNSAKANYKL